VPLSVEAFITPHVENAINELVSVGVRITHLLMAILTEKNQSASCGWCKHVWFPAFKIGFLPSAGRREIHLPPGRPLLERKANKAEATGIPQHPL